MRNADFIAIGMYVLNMQYLFLHKSRFSTQHKSVRSRQTKRNRLAGAFNKRLPENNFTRYEALSYGINLFSL